MSDLFSVIIGIVVALVVFVFIMDDEKTRWQQEAVDNNAAYWCIVDHEKVFSWDECD